LEFTTIHREVKEISREGSEIMTTIAEKLLNEGMEKGKEKGFVEAKSETAIRQLSKKFGELPEEVSTSLKEADMETLDVILEQIFDLQSLEEVKKILNKKQK